MRSYSGPHLALLLLGQGGSAHPASEHSLATFRTSWLPHRVSEAETVTETDRLTVTDVGVCMYHFITPTYFRLSTHVTRFQQSTGVICLPPKNCCLPTYTTGTWWLCQRSICNKTLLEVYFINDENIDFNVK